MSQPIRLSSGKGILALDPLRMGGMRSVRKHNFGQSDSGTTIPEASPEVTTTERAAIREASEGFLLAAETTMVEILDSATQALNLDNEDFGGFLSRAEALGQALKEAKVVDTRVKEFMTKSSAAPYLEETHRALASKISEMYSDIERAAAPENAQFTQKEPTDTDLSEEKLQQRTEHLPEIARDIDIMVVEAEAKGVDVLEPAEVIERGRDVTRGDMDVGIMPLVGIGLMAAAAWALYTFLSKK